MASKFGFIWLQRLGEDKVILHRRRETFKKQMAKMTSEYEALKAQLNDNETYAQVNIVLLYTFHQKTHPIW